MAVVILAVSTSAGAAERRVAAASVGADGLVHVRSGDGTEFVAPREVSPVQIEGSDDKQSSVEPPVIADDGRTAGWLVNFPSCCTSYPIPLVLVIYRDGRIVRRIVPSVVLPIWKWAFLNGGARVAYYSETVHGGLGRRAELRDVTSGKVIDFWDRDEWGRKKSRPLPRWARVFAQELADPKDEIAN